MKIAVLISGRGTNLQALIDACAVPAFPGEIAVVVSNVPGAAGLERAHTAGLETHTVDHRAHAGRPEFEDALHDVLTRSGAELVCLAGFMRLLTAGFVDRWRDRLINIHPSLLPSYKGLDTHPYHVFRQFPYRGNPAGKIIHMFPLLLFCPVHGHFFGKHRFIRIMDLAEGGKYFQDPGRCRVRVTNGIFLFDQAFNMGLVVPGERCIHRKSSPLTSIPFKFSAQTRKCSRAVER